MAATSKRRRKPARTPTRAKPARSKKRVAVRRLHDLAAHQADLERIVDDLLDVTRIAHGKIQLRREQVDIVALVDRTVVDHRAAFEYAGVTIDVAGVAGPQWVDVDPARMVQVVSNVLGNALELTPHGGKVTLAIERRGDDVVLCVRDTGAGISSELPYLFEPFAQPPQGSDRHHGGLGLGLSMVKGLVELHGGSVTITSAGPGYGTEVRVSLPLARPRAAPPVAPLPRMAARRVLVIEDQRDSSRALEQALTLVGLDVRTAASGPAGLDVAREFAPQVVLCDIGLPGMDGYAVARAFADDPRLRDVYLIALSGYARPEDVERSKAAGFMHHIAKPASLDALVRAIAAAPA